MSLLTLHSAKRGFYTDFATLDAFWRADVGTGTVVGGALQGAMRGIVPAAPWSLVQRLGTEMYVLAFAQCPDGSMIAGTYPTGQVYRSTDNGQSWSLVQRLGTEMYVLALARCADGSMIAGTNPTGQVYRSTDNGQSWSLVQRLGTEAQVFAFAQCPDGSMIAGTAGTGHVYRSTDNGQSWSFVQRLGTETQVLALAQCADGSMVAGTNPTGHVYRSTDNGQSWSLIQRLGAETYVFALARCADGSMVAGTIGTGQVWIWGNTILTAPCRPNGAVLASAYMPATGVVLRSAIVRYSDDLNYWEARLTPNTAGTDLQLVEVAAGVATVRASADIDWTANNRDEIWVGLKGALVEVYHRKAGADVWTLGCSYASATHNLGATRHGVMLWSTGRDVFDHWGYRQ